MSLVYVVNPKKRKSRSKPKAKRRAPRRAAAVAVAAPKRRRRRAAAAPKVRRYKRNPRFSVGGTVKNFTGMLVPAAIAGAGALAVDVVLPKLPLPDRLKTGYLRHVSRGAVAVGLGMLVSLFKRDLGKQVLAGGLTVAMYGAMRDGLNAAAPSVPLADIYDDDELGTFANDLQALLTDEKADGGFGDIETVPSGVGSGDYNQYI